MEVPYLGIADPLTHILEVQMETWMESFPEPPELIVTLLLPNEISRLYRLLQAAYVSSLPSIPILMEDRIPNLAPNSLPISCMVWNVQGASSRAFMAALKELVRIHKPNVIALVETHMGDFFWGSFGRSSLYYKKLPPTFLCCIRVKDQLCEDCDLLFEQH